MLKPVNKINGGDTHEILEKFTIFAAEYFAKNANYDGCMENGIEYPAEMRNLPPLHKIYDGAIGINRSDKLYYFNANHLGSGSLITDENGQTYQTLAYTPYGSQLVDIKHYSDIYNEPYKFGGKIKDEESGLNYFEARYYWDDGSFPISTDPHWYNRLYLSPYVWCANNPIMRVDKNGKDDYINEEGKYLGSDYAKTNNQRAITTEDYNKRLEMEGKMSPEMITGYLQSKGREITFENANAEIASMWNNSVSSLKERSGLLIFDFDNAMVKFEEIAVYGATSTSASFPQKAGDRYAGGIVLANLHTHIVEHTFLGKIAADTKQPITDYYNFNFQYSGSNSDGNRAKWQGANYTIGKFNVDYFSPRGKGDSKNNFMTHNGLLNNSSKLLKHALKNYGK
jgi:RHS repeat-associated protein